MGALTHGRSNGPGLCLFVLGIRVKMTFDVDKFIQGVQMQPAIWEMGSPLYMDRNEKDRSWTSIGEMMFSTWAEQTNAEREEQVKVMKEKWRHIRDNYSRFINPGKSGDPAKKKKYIYADALNFLLHTLQKRRTTGNVREREEEENFDTPSPQERQEPNGVEEGIVGSIDGPEKRRARRSQGPTSFQSQLLAKLDASKSEGEDADKAFLLSLLPELKKLNDDQKLDFRFHSLQFFRDIRRGQNSFHNRFPQRNILPQNGNYPLAQSPNSVLQFHSQYQNSPTTQQYLPTPPRPAHRHETQNSTSPLSHISDDSVYSSYEGQY